MSDSAPDSGLPQLTPVEARILAGLVEKEATTPEAYPLTANAVQLACNQKNGRDPVMALTPGEVGHALRAMEQRGLVRSVHGARAQRYEHRVAETWSLTRQQQAVVAVLLARGAQTAAELAARCERLAPPMDADGIRQLLERLAQRGLVVDIGRLPGQRENRYMHLLCGPVDAGAALAAAARGHSADDGTASAANRGETQPAHLDELRARVAALEAEVALLLLRLDRIAPPPG